MIRNVLIAVYIFAVLAISAIARAEVVNSISTTPDAKLSFDSKVMVTN